MVHALGHHHWSHSALAMTPVTPPPAEATERRSRRDLEPVPPRQAGIDRFDEAVVVTRTRAWIGLTAGLAMVVAVIVWASLAEIYKTIPAEGVALAHGVLAHVQSPATGVVTKLKVSEEQYVTAGQTLGTVARANGQTVPIVARVSGQVLQINQGVGAEVTADKPIVSIAQTSGPLVVRTFVSASAAQLLRVGTRVLMDFPGERSVSGRVSEIGNIPLSAQEAASSIGAASLARVVGATGDSVSVLITPGRSWTRRFDGFDVASLTFIYGQEHPIGYVF